MNSAKCVRTSYNFDFDLFIKDLSVKHIKSHKYKKRMHHPIVNLITYFGNFHSNS